MSIAVCVCVEGVGECRRLNVRRESSGVSSRSGEATLLVVVLPLDMADGGSTGEGAAEEAAEEDVDSRERGHDVAEDDAVTFWAGSSSESLSSSHFPCDRLFTLLVTSLGRNA